MIIGIVIIKLLVHFNHTKQQTQQEQSYTYVYSHLIFVIRKILPGCLLRHKARLGEPKNFSNCHKALISSPIIHVQVKSNLDSNLWWYFWQNQNYIFSQNSTHWEVCLWHMSFRMQFSTNKNMKKYLDSTHIHTFSLNNEHYTRYLWQIIFKCALEIFIHVVEGFICNTTQKKNFSFDRAECWLCNFVNTDMAHLGLL